MGNKSQTEGPSLTGTKKFTTPFEFDVAWSANPPEPRAQVTVSGPKEPRSTTLTLQSPRWSFVLQDDAGHRVDGVLTLRQQPKLIELNASIKVASNEAFVGRLSSWSSEQPSAQSAPQDDEETKSDRKSKRDRASK